MCQQHPRSVEDEIVATDVMQLVVEEDFIMEFEDVEEVAAIIDHDFIGGEETDNPIINDLMIDLDGVLLNDIDYENFFMRIENIVNIRAIGNNIEDNDAAQIVEALLDHGYAHSPRDEPSSSNADAASDTATVATSDLAQSSSNDAISGGSFCSICSSMTTDSNVAPNSPSRSTCSDCSQCSSPMSEADSNMTTNNDSSMNMIFDPDLNDDDVQDMMSYDAYVEEFDGQNSSNMSQY